MSGRPGRLVLLGHPVSHSLSPLLHTAALRAARVPLAYEIWDVEPAALRHVMGGLVASHAAGNITVPHKEAAVGACARLTPMARRVGAVNTFWTAPEGLIGDNTDVGGFHSAVVGLRGDAPHGVTVGVLGAGGAAAAVLAAVAAWPGCRARVWNRTADRAIRLCARFPEIASLAPTPRHAVTAAALVVNATTIGLENDDLPIDPALLEPGADVVDLVYRRGETPWIRAVRAAGHRAQDGLPMLVEQAALAFECWFGTAPDRTAMWSAVRGMGDRE